MRLETKANLAAGFSLEGVSMCLLNGTSDAVIGIDCAGRIQSWNPSAERIYGYTPSEIIGIKISILFASENEGNEWTAAEEKLSSGEPLRGLELRHIHKNGSAVHVSIDMYPLLTHDGSPAGTCIAARETTRYRMLQSQLRQTQKLEAVGRLSSGIAHDFNNLLTVISGYNSMIQIDYPVGTEARDCAEQIAKASEQAASLTNQLLAFSRREITQLKVLNLNDIVRDLDKMLGRIVGKDITIVLSLEPSIGNIKADPGQISQMLTNLVVNAKDAMPRGGTLAISSRNVDISEPETAHEYELPSGSYAQLTVADGGCGMDQDTQEHLFEPFFTTKPKGKGTGLGLSIVYGIVSQLRGAISVTSRLGVGTTFTICLPATVEQATENSVTPERAPQSQFPFTILLVEDDGAVRHLARYMLLKQGHTVYETADPREAIRISETVHIDVLLTDIVIPEMNGVDLAVRVLQSNPALRVLYMSGYIEDSSLPLSCLEPGFNFIQKPFTAAKLHSQLMAICTVGRQTAAPAAS
jgi:PAS domain S-box-containing protein